MAFNSKDVDFVKKVCLYCFFYNFVTNKEDVA